MAQTAFHGNIGKVRPIQFSNDGKARISFSVAESHSRFDKQANAWQDTGTTWRNVTVFGKRAEALAEVLQEGAKQQVVVIGREETRDWQKDDGTTGQSFDVVADVVGLIPQAPRNGQSQGAQNVAAQLGGQQQDPWGAPSGGSGGWPAGNQSEAPF